MLLELFKRSKEVEELRELLNQAEDVTRSNPRDDQGRVLALDDVVLYNGARYRVVAMSHRGKVSIRHVSMHGGCGARWVPADCVSFITSQEVFR